jgi:NAD(P)-dependent dehydrogenase (short-subunit alcohol dehydrogenase family)
MKRILITGANRGLGLALSAAYAARGDRVFAACRKPTASGDLAALEEQYPNQVTAIRLDVTNEAEIATAAKSVAEKVIALDVLINNAAVHYEDVSLSKVQSRVLLDTLQVNAVSPVLVAKYFRDLLLKGDHPRLINISSEAGSIANMTRFRGYAYYGSKAALNMFTRALAVDPEMEGVVVAAMHPGWVRTDMGGPHAHLAAEESAAGILGVIDTLSLKDSGKFFTWEGVEHPW